MHEGRPIGGDVLRTWQDAHAPKGRKTRYSECRALACHAATAEGKPFCFDHLLLHPYALAVQKALIRRKEIGPRDVEAERRERVRRRRAAQVRLPV